MTTHPGSSIRVALAVLALGISLASTAHATQPREHGSRIVASKRRAAPPRPKLDLVPGQAVRFPRELLPELLGEVHADIDEPGEERPREPRDIAGLEGMKRPSLPTNVLINSAGDDPPGATQSENSIAAHGRYLVAGWNESNDPGTPRSFSGFGYSRDGGKSWTDGGTLPHADTTDFTVGDPSLAADRDGNFYYASLYTPDGEALGVSVSRGRFRSKSFNFGPPVVVAMPDSGEDGLDKEWIAVDPENGALYVTYTRFFLDGSGQIELVRSRDHGRTWSKPLVLTDRARDAAQGSRPAVGPDHEVYVVYSSIDLADFTFHVRIRKSTHAGRRFGPAVEIGEDKGDSGISPNVVTGPPGFNRSMGVELPSIAIDRTEGDGEGNVYVAWPEAVDYFSDLIGGDGVTAESEGNDTPVSATPFALGVSLTGTLGSATDADWFSFSGKAGQTVEFFLTPSPGVESEGYLRLFCRDGATGDRLAFSYLGGGQGFIVFTLPTDGTYLLRVLPVNPRAPIGDYYVFTGAHVKSEHDVARDARDVVLSRSRDGIHWSRRTVVNHDAPLYDNAFPEVAVDGRGDVHVIWYDHRNDPACGILTDVYASRSSHEGRRFDADRKVNDGPGINWSLTPSRFAPNMGDYIALTADGKNVYANWADGRLGSPDSWMASLNGEARYLEDSDLDAGDIASVAPATAPGSFALHVANPSRLGAGIPLSFELPRAGAARLEIFSVTGQRVRSLVDGTLPAGAQHVTWDARGRDGASVAPGVYFAVLRSGEGRISKRLVLVE